MARAIGVLLVAICALAACGTEKAETTAPMETTAPAETAATTTTTVGIVPIDVDPCELLTAEDVAAATGLAVQETYNEPPISCVFELDADPAVQIVVILEDGMGRLAGAANLLDEYLILAAEGEADLIADVGERSVCCPFRAIAVDAGGSRFFAVAVGGGYNELAEPLDVLVSLARSVLGRL